MSTTQGATAAAVALDKSFTHFFFRGAFSVPSCRRHRRRLMPGTCARGRRLDSCGLYLLRAQIESPFSFLVFFFVVHGNLQFANGKLRSKFSDAGWLFRILYRDGFGNNSRRCCCGRQSPFLHELRNNSFTLVSVGLQGNVRLERKPTFGGWGSWNNVHCWEKHSHWNYNVFV